MAIEGDRCIDAGSEYCPCYLAEMNKCITCTRLNGKDYCDCIWRGVCINQEYHFLGNKKKDVRQYQEATIIQRELLGENAIIFTLKVPHSLARQLKQPGSYIFIRNRRLEQFFDMPISIMYADQAEGIIKIAVEIHGVKTQSIKNVEDTLLIKGPYWNGLFGIEDLKKTKGANCLVLARGIAQAPAVLAVKYLMKNKNDVKLLIDRSSTKYNLIQEYCNAEILNDNCDFYSKEGKDLLRHYLNIGNYELIFVGGSDYLHQNLLDIIKENNKYKIVLTNNKEICCGEGVCGACTVYDADGIPIRSCKTQIKHH